MFEQVGIVQNGCMGQKSEQTIEESDLCSGFGLLWGMKLGDNLFLQQVQCRLKL